MHPKGVPSNSPGLRSYPGNIRKSSPTPTRVASKTTSHKEDETPSRFACNNAKTQGSGATLG